MDLVAGCKKVIVTTTHTDKNGKSKILSECSFPLTGHEVAHTIITELAVFDIDHLNGKLVLTEVAPGVSIEEITAKTDAPFELATDGVKEMSFHNTK